MKTFTKALLLIFFTIISIINTQAQNNKTIIQLHTNVGKEIDNNERQTYELFKFYLNKDFKQAIVYTLEDSVFVEITNQSDSIQRFLLTENELKAEIKKIENTSFKPIEKPQDIEQTQKAVSQDFNKLKLITELHPILGKTIEHEEKVKYNLLEHVPSQKFSSAVLYKSNNYHFFEIIDFDNVKTVQYVTEADILKEFKKVSLYDHEQKKALKNPTVLDKMYITASSSFYNINIFNSHFLDNNGFLPDLVTKSMYNRFNINAGVGFSISNSSSLELGINVSRMASNEINIDTNYTAYYLISRLNTYSYSAEPFDINSKKNYYTKATNVGLNLGLKSYIGKNNFIRTYLKNALVFNFFNENQVIVNEQVLRKRQSTNLIYSDKSSIPFSSNAFQLNMMLVSGLGGEIKIDEGIFVFVDLQLQYIGGKLTNKNEGLTKYYIYKTLNFTPNVGIQIAF
jgi:hypothetical protein